MIKVTELNKHGIKLAIDDCILGMDHGFSLNCEFQIGRFADKDNEDRYHVTAFTPRLNLGRQPVGDDVVVEVVIEREISTEKLPPMMHTSTHSVIASELAWGPKGVLSWKPCMKWLMELVEDKSKPIDSAGQMGGVSSTGLEIGNLTMRDVPEVKVYLDGDELPEFLLKAEKEAMAGKTSAKHDQDKPMYNLLPANAIESMAQVLTYAVKVIGHKIGSWRYVEDGLERYRAALLRHAFAIQRGELLDEESGLPHSAHIMCCAAFINELEGE